MKFRTLVILVGAILISSSAYAIPNYYIASGVLPADLATLQAGRANWQTAWGGALATEGFESFTDGNPIDFGPFTATLSNGNGLYQQSGNSLITTEGNSVMYFGALGASSVEFAFDNAINAFGIDITSIDYASTVVSFFDENGNALYDFATPDQWAGATFFGVTNDHAFSRVRFDFTSDELLAFDNLQYGSAVPEPATLSLLGLGLLGLARAYRRKK